MKSKTFSKKLILNKKTVADLNNKGMKGLVGGGPGLLLTCLTCTDCSPSNEPPELCHCLNRPSEATGYCQATGEGC